MKTIHAVVLSLAVATVVACVGSPGTSAPETALTVTPTPRPEMLARGERAPEQTPTATPVAVADLPSSPTPVPTLTATTPAPTPDGERQTIISFTRRVLEIEAKRDELVAYFAGLRDEVGIHGQAFAIERYFSRGVPATLRNAPAVGIEGMASLRNQLALSDSPQSMQLIKDALLHIYDSEIQQALDQGDLDGIRGEYGSDSETHPVRIQAFWGGPIRNLVHPGITPDNLDYWRQSAEQSEVGPQRNVYRYKVDTIWFSLQEFRRQTYERWAEILQEHSIDPVGDGLPVQAAPAGGFRETPGSIGEEALGAEAIYLNVAGISAGRITDLQKWHASFSQQLHALFKVQQRLGLVSALGFEPYIDWAEYVPYMGGDATRVLSAIASMTTEQREHAGVTFESEASGTMEEVQALVRLAVPYPAWLAEKIASYVPRTQLTWVAAGQPGAFVDYLGSDLGFDNWLVDIESEDTR